MKKIVSLVMMSLMTLHLMAARIPIGSVVYLDASQAWCCQNTYAVCTTESGNAARIMTKVDGVDGVYAFIVPQFMANNGGLQDNFQFGYSAQTYTQNQPSWDNFYTHEPSGHWSAAKPYYIVTDDNGGGYWAAQPVSTGVTALDSIVVKTPTTCVDSTYAAVAYIYFNGSPCSIQVAGDQLQAYRTTDIRNPLIVRIQENIKEPEGQTHFVAVTLYKNRNYTDEVANLQVTYMAPEIECEVEYDLGDKCANEALSLSTDAEGDVYMWSTGASTKSIKVTPVVGEQTYTVEVYKSVLHPAENLMSNGDFETNPPTGFTSDYRYVGWDKSDYYSDPAHAGASNLYVITKNANTFWHAFASIEPHGGTYYALFDAGKNGYAWKATTTNNPNLKVQKDSIYLFSYWAAYPNKARNNSPAVLQFEIMYRDANGTDHYQSLGAKDTLGKEEKLNDWYQRTVSWKAPIDADYVQIGVKDLNHAEGGNDFALDDIMFQKASITNILLSRREIFHVNGIDCGIPTPDPPIDPDPECSDNWLRTKWTDVIFVDNSDGEFVRYQWFKNNQEIAGATEQYYRAEQNIARSTDLYHAKMWKADGTLVITCPKAFSEISQSHLEFPYQGAAQVVERRMHVVGSHFRIVETIYDDGRVEAVKEVY